jgi:hypothetical protein
MDHLVSKDLSDALRDPRQSQSLPLCMGDLRLMEKEVTIKLLIINYFIMQNESGEEPRGSLQEDVDKLKAPGRNRERFDDSTVRSLVNAIDIIKRLRQDAFLAGSKDSWDKLDRVERYLAEVLEQHFGGR